MFDFHLFESGSHENCHTKVDWRYGAFCTQIHAQCVQDRASGDIDFVRLWLSRETLMHVIKQLLAGSTPNEIARHVINEGLYAY